MPAGFVFSLKCLSWFYKSAQAFIFIQVDSCELDRGHALYSA